MIGLMLTLAISPGCAPHVDGADTGADDLPVCINEFMPDNESTLQDTTGAWPDWIELHNPTDRRVYLDGWTLTDDRLEPDMAALDDLLLEPGGFLVLYADGGAVADTDHLPFALAKDGGDLGLFDPDGRGAVISYGLVEDDFSVARLPDCCAGPDCLEYSFRGTPGRSNVPVVTEEIELLPAGSTWRYHTGAVEPGWQETDHDDDRWASGTAPLGYGDAHQVTVIDYGPDASAKHITSWFRLELELVERLDAVRELRLELLRDDGALVWLDGVEVARDNLPAGDVGPSTTASSTVNDAAETAIYVHLLDPGVLGPGTHVLAVEVHQAAPDSSDLGFDLAIVAEVAVKSP